jgi:hypothetical protein
VYIISPRRIQQDGSTSCAAGQGDSQVHRRAISAVEYSVELETVRKLIRREVDIIRQSSIVPLENSMVSPWPGAGLTDTAVTQGIQESLRLTTYDAGLETLTSQPLVGSAACFAHGLRNFLIMGGSRPLGVLSSRSKRAR